MKKLIGFGALGAVALAGGIAVAQTKSADGAVTRAEAVARADARFAKRDANKDGRITIEDRAAAAKARADRRFAMLDADGNGQISRAEFDSAHAKRMARRGERGERAPGKFGRHGRGGPGFDADRDGVLTREEARAAALARFDRVDANKDGTLTVEERQAAREAWRAARNR